MKNENISELFDYLTDKIETFIQVIDTKELSINVTDKWNVKGVLCHLVFWHEYYGANYGALAKNKVPKLLKGKYTDISERGVDSLMKYSKEELIERLRKAQRSLHTSIVVKKVPKMTYKEGSRDYTSAEFLEMIAHHVNSHTTQVKRAKKK